MSFDGSTIVKINNPKLKALLEEAEKKGLCIKPFMENSKYDFSVENYDCSLGEGCPTDLDDLRDYILQLIEVVNGFDHYQDYWFKKVFEDEYPNLKDSFTYVSWTYVPADYDKSDYDNEDILEFKYGKPGRKKSSNKKQKGPSTLKEIFPSIDMTKPSGLVIDDDGCCTGYDRKQHAVFLGEENCLFITKAVRTIEDEDDKIFDLLTMYDKCVVTSDLEDFGEYYNCGGFHLFYIIDAETNKVVYSSEKDEFCADTYGLSLSLSLEEEEDDHFNEVLGKYTKCDDSYNSGETEEESDEDKKEDTSTAKTSSSKSTSAKSTKKNEPSTLKEIFPGIDLTKPSGLVIVDDGHCTSYDMKQHAEFLGEENCLFITKAVKTIEDDEAYLTVGDIPDNCYILFNYKDKYDKCVVTTNLENFGPFYDCAGFHMFYIIDAKTNKVVYSSEKDEFCAAFNETDLEFDVIDKLYKVLEKHTKCDGSSFYGEIDEEFDEYEEEEVTSTSNQARVQDPIDEEARAKARAEEWMQYYGKNIDHNPIINFDGSLFVFTGFGHRSEKEDPIVQKVIEKGGQYRSKVSGLTNYLVVDPRNAGETKVEAAIEQREKGKNIQIVLLEDLEKALEGKTTTKRSSKNSAKTTASKASSSKSTSTKSTTKSDSSKSKRDSSSSSKKSIETSKSNELCDIDDTGRLTRYRGRETDIVLPTGIKIIGRSAFEYGEITSVVIPEGVETIDDCAFSECKNLRSVKLPSTLKEIGGDAFSYCEQLTSIVIPDGVETIGDSIFPVCKNLKSVKLPNTIKIIGRNAFDTCEQLTSIVIPEGVETIDYSAFANCKNLKSVKLPNTIKIIGAFAFDTCEQLTSIVIPEGVETIDNYAFSACKELKDIYVPDSVHVIGKYAFDTDNDDTTVHTVRGSRADIEAQKYCKVDYRYPSSSTASTASSKTTYTPASSSRATATSSNSTNYSTSKVAESSNKSVVIRGIAFTPEEVEELKSYYPDRKMGAVKYVKDLKNIGVDEAKKLVEEYLFGPPSYTTSSNSTSKTPSSDSTNTSSGGCYVATAVYGSYDCPEVWTLRRYRDYTLAETWYGRAFIKAYYAISPTLVKWFGHTDWFKTMWRGILDQMVSNLRKQGVESTPYQDRNW